MNTEQAGFKKFKANKLRIYEDGYIGPHGWYWGSHTIASFIAKAIQAKHGYNMADVLDYTTIYVSELVKVPAGGLARGCHDTLYSVTALVDLSLELPTAEEIYNAYKHNNAHFSGVEAIKGGYHFTVSGSQNGDNSPSHVNTSINKDYEHIQKIGRKNSIVS